MTRKKRQKNIGLTEQKDGKQFRQKPGPEGRRAGLGPGLPVAVKMSRLRTSNTADEEGVVTRDNDACATEKKKSIIILRV